MEILKQKINWILWVLSWLAIWILLYIFLDYLSDYLWSDPVVIQDVNKDEGFTDPNRKFTEKEIVTIFVIALCGSLLAVTLDWIITYIFKK